jgi:glucose/mannose-6-phosphate isomerase
MKQAIRDFPKQLKFVPKVENKFPKAKSFVVSGMGGSHLAADLIKVWNPAFDITVHHDYGLPAKPDSLKNYLTIISSYSGNTEEAIDGFKQAVSKKLPVACVSTGGELLKLAQKHKKPFVRIPDTGIEPRSALGFSLVSLLKIMGEEKALSEIKKVSFNMAELEKTGKSLADRLKDYIPVIYTSTVNEPIGYNWKIRFNETGKIPCFYNTFPELNHNEMVGFDREGESRKLSDNFYFIIIRDEKDHKRNLLRMDILKDIYKDKGLKVEFLELKGKNIWEKIFTSLTMADWAAYYTAQIYKLEAQETAIITRFKGIIKEKGGML